MIEVKVLGLVNRLQSATKRATLTLLNRRSIRAINRYNKLEASIANSREFLDSYEDVIEQEYQQKDAAINAAYKQVSGM